MAKLLWGKVYFHDFFAGILQEEPGERMSFTYDKAYLNNEHPPIAYTLPLQETPHVCIAGLHPFFDNLVSEGWLEHAQTRLLGKRTISRFELLLAFGYDCAGAVSILDPDPSPLSEMMLNLEDPKEMAVFTSRASLSGIQPKLALIKKGNKFAPAQVNQLSTHIAKFPSRGHDDLVINEYLTTQAFKALLPKDTVVNLWVSEVEGFNEPALIIERFDRANNNRIHFEEFTQLLSLKAKSKYEGAYRNMSDFMHRVQGGPITEIYRLYGRILAGILLGNTDMHLKNFALFHKPNGLSLTPSYDQVAAALYDYKSIALAIGNSSNLPIGNLKAKTLVELGNEFGLSPAAINMLVQQLRINLQAAKDAIAGAKLGSKSFKNKMITMMEKRWNGTFASIGQYLSKKQ
jgi:serine/threonine-protein kinase HipA